MAESFVANVLLSDSMEAATLLKSSLVSAESSEISFAAESSSSFDH